MNFYSEKGKKKRKKPGVGGFGFDQRNGTLESGIGCGNALYLNSPYSFSR